VILFRYAVRTLAAIGLLFLAVTLIPAIDRSMIGILSGQWNEPKGDILIVLGADTVDGMIGESSYWRSTYATRSWGPGGFRRMLISGGAVPGQAAPARLMEEFVACQGIPRAAIDTETKSTSTRQNALYTAQLLANTAGRKILLTSDYHMFRAYRAFRKAGLDVIPSPIPDAAKRASYWNTRWPVFLTLCYEGCKIGYYFVRGWI